MVFFNMIFALVALNVAANAGTFTVTTTIDGLGTNSLREAINAANNTSDATFTININIGAGGLKTILPSTPLPQINVPNSTTLIIDATTMPGYAGAPLLQLSGGAAGAGANGLTIIRGNVVIKGFIINNFSQYGISLQCPNMASDCSSFGALSVYGSYIGTTADGLSPLGNANGIYLRTHEVFGQSILTASNIGGTAANQRNVISGNTFNGIVIDSPQSFNDVRVVNNYIGTNPGGSGAVPNGTNGIYLLDTTPGSARPSGIDVYLGGPASAERNIISGNGDSGIRIDQPDIDLWIRGNYIGTNAAGTGDLGNAQNGVYLTESQSGSGNQIGGKASGEGNVISGNDQNGINSASSSISVYGNRIGTNAAGTAALPNAVDGVHLTAGATIGDTQSNGGNTISGNGEDGIHIADSNFPTLIWGNRIGVNGTGTAALPNSSVGIRVAAPVSVGASGATQFNIIGGNTSHGIFFNGSQAQGSEIKDNYIGTNAAGADLGNGGDGIRAFGPIQDVLIGDTSGGDNTIAFNNGDGVYLQPGLGGVYPDNFSIRGNAIHSNTGLGIDLGPADGITPNDMDDPDTGPNGLQNFPVLQIAYTTVVSGYLNSTPNKDLTLDFYRIDSCDVSGHGEGRYYLGSASVHTNAGGNVNFTATLTNAVTAGQIVTATASETQIGSLYSRTSEFSPCLTVSPPPGEVKLSSAAYGASESNANVAIIVSRINGSSGTITVNYATSNGTAAAGEDYSATSGTLTFAGGETAKLLSIPVLNDSKDEPDETLNVTISNPTGGATLANPSTAVVTLTDNDDPPTISVNDISLVEGNENLTAFTFDVSLSEGSGFPISANWTTSAATATQGVDYQANSGTVNFAPGETTKQVMVQVYGETLVEINETFNLALSSPVMATIADGSGAAAILDDDNPGKFAFSLSPYNTGEAGGFAIATVTRTGGDAGTATVDYVTTSGGTASPMADFVPVSDTLIFLDGEVQKTFTVAVLDDQVVEQTESINLVLSNPTGGATLALAGAVINVIDNDSGTPLMISGTVKLADNTPFPNVQVNLQGSQTLTAVTDANGMFNFTGLNPNGNYTVTPSIIGYIFNPINHEYLNLSVPVTNANFTAIPAPERTVRVVGGDAVPGQGAEAAIELVAQGDENSIAFSLQFDPTVLSNPQVGLGTDAQAASLLVNDSEAAQGRIGVVLALPAGQAFIAGTRTLAVITFNTAQTNAYSTPLNFGNSPTFSETANVNADPLPVTYTNGTVTFAQGLEGDVAPRATGNGSVTVADFTQIGRFVAGLNTFDNADYNEFQRADIAPRISKGNGGLTVSDYAQAGRYAAGLDAVQTAGGPSQLSLVEGSRASEVIFGGPSRTIRAANASSSPGQLVSVPIEIDANGDENGFGFSLNFDPSKLGSPLVELGAGVPVNAVLFTNTNQTGKVGVVLALPTGATLTAGTRHLVTVRFTVGPTASAGLTPITFGDSPVFREVVNTNADALQTAYTDGTIDVLGPTAASVNVAGRITNASGNGVGGVNVSIVDASGNTKSAISSPFGYYRFSDIAAGSTYVVSVNSSRYQFSPANRVITVLDEITDADFTAEMNE